MGEAADEDAVGDELESVGALGDGDVGRDERARRAVVGLASPAPAASSAAPDTSPSVATAPAARPVHDAHHPLCKSPLLQASRAPG